MRGVRRIARMPLTACILAGCRAALRARATFSRLFDAPVAQLDRALASGAKGYRFDPCRAHHTRRQGRMASESLLRV